MKRSVIAIAVLAFIVLVILSALHSLSDAKVHGNMSNSLQGDGLTTAQKTEAIAIAVNDPGTQNASNGRSIYPGNITAAGYQELGGYVNIMGTLVDVPIYFDKKEDPNNEHMIARVDLTNKSVLGFYHAPQATQAVAPTLSVTIPPGSGWYQYISQSADDYTYITIEPANATVYPILLDDAGLAKYKRGEPYEAQKYVDSITDETYFFDGSVPVRAEMRINFTMPGNESPSRRYLVVLENKNKDDVTLKYGFGGFRPRP